MSEVKVNKISPRSGTDVQLGDSGDTFTIPSGATINNQGTAVNFGATGSASWNTTVKTGDFTAVAGEGYFVNTTSGEIDVALPAGTAGAVVALKDYAQTFDTNHCILVPNGSDKIGGLALSAKLKIEGQAVTLIFIDSTQGWLVTDSGLQSDAATAQFVTATGGTVLTNGNFKTHVFTGPGTFCVSSAGNSCGSNTLDYFVVAGGGGSADNPGDSGAGGGGAGGFRVSNSVGCVPAPTMSPLTNSTGLPVSVQGYPVTVGAGATNTPPGCGSPRNPGSNSVFAGSSTITSAGGGGSGRVAPAIPNGSGLPGGSGGGGSQGPTPSSGYAGGSGNTPPVSPPQGNNGGTGFDGLSVSNTGGGGGGAGAVGANAALSNGGNGGAGSFISDTFFGPTAPSYGTPGPVSSTRYFAGGGGGMTDNPNPGGAGGVGGGGTGNPSPGTPSTNGIVNTGGGTGGSAPSGGGSGIVVIRYKFQ